MEKSEKWTCIVEFNATKHAVTYRVIGFDVSLEVSKAVEDCLKNFKKPLRSDAPRGYVKIRSGDAEVEHSGVKSTVNFWVRKSKNF